MKPLQNNFTTPDQLKRLSELGVPADSADCCLRRMLTDGGYCETWRVDVFDFIGQIHDDYLPCWAVGRLMEIYDICFIYPKSRSSWCAHTRVKGVLFVDYILDCYKHAISDNYIDFSKLED